MKFNKLYFEKYKDIFNYHTEIQKINNGFRLYINKLSKQIVIVNIFNNYEICHKFDSVLKINLDNLRFLKINNLNYIMKSIEEYNNKIETKTEEKRKELVTNFSKEFIKLSNKTHTISQTDINKIIGATKC